MENIEYFDFLNVLNENTVLAHCIHISDKETALIKKHNSGISHCPSSNLKLGSGIADIPKYLKNGIKVSLGADGSPCNNSLSIFNEMRLAALLQKPFYNPTVMDAETVFRMATIEGAEALNIAGNTGSIKPGKKADLVLLDLEMPDQPLVSENENIYSSIVYSASKENVISVMIDGKWVYKNKEFRYDEKELYFNGKAELKGLISRAFN
jgi:5-methylthioadenosine/S-adenosylhomocysteine deaminase